MELGRLYVVPSFPSTSFVTHKTTQFNFLAFTRAAIASLFAP